MHHNNRQTPARWINIISAFKRMFLVFIAVVFIFQQEPVLAAEAEIYQGEPAVYDVEVRHTVREILPEGNYVITIPASLQLTDTPTALRVYTETYSLRKNRGVCLAVKSANGFKLKCDNDPNYAVKYDLKYMDLGELGIVGDGDTTDSYIYAPDDWNLLAYTVYSYNGDEFLKNTVDLYFSVEDDARDKAMVEETYTDVLTFYTNIERFFIMQ